MSGFTLEEARALLGTRVSARFALTCDLRSTPRASYIRVGEEGTIVAAERSYDSTGYYELTVEWDERRLSPHGYAIAKRGRLEPAHFGSGLLTHEPLGDPA